MHTLIDVLEHRVNQSASEDALTAHRLGQWHTFSWTQLWRVCEHIAAGLMSLNLEPGDRVGLIAQTCLEWVWCDFATMMAAGVVVPLYPSDRTSQQIKLLRLATCSILIVEHPGQLMALAPFLKDTAVRHVIVMHPSVVQDDEQTGHAVSCTLDDVWGAFPSLELCCVELTTLIAQGRRHLDDHLKQVVARRRGLSATDLASMVYTSGTTSAPRGVCLTHGHFVAQIKALGQVDLVRPDDSNLLILPLAHVFARVVVFASIFHGTRTIFARKVSSLFLDARETQPTLIACVPYIFDRIARKMKKQMTTSQGAHGHLYKMLFEPHWFGGRKRAGAFVLHRQVRAMLGGELRMLISGGAALRQDVARFFIEMGFELIEGYGLTETTAALTLNGGEDFRFGSVGQILPGVDVTIGYDGEILARGHSVASEMMDVHAQFVPLLGDDGWLHTGDLGHFDEDGFLWLTGRKKSIIVTSNGKNVCPDTIEQQLGDHDVLAHVVIYGDAMPYLVAIMTVVDEALLQWARANESEHLGRDALLASPLLRAAIASHVDQVNAALSRHEMVRKFVLVSETLSTENEMLTPTLKVKRQVVYSHFEAALESLYGELWHGVR